MRSDQKNFNTVEKLKEQEPEAWELIQSYAKRLGIDLSKWELSYACTYEFEGWFGESPHQIFNSGFYNDDMEDHSLRFEFTKDYEDNPPDEWVIENIEITQD